MQVQMLSPAGLSGGKLPGPLQIVASVWQKQGVRGLWLGHTGTLIRETGGSAAWFTTKEAVAGYLASRRLSTKDSLSSISSASSKPGPPPPLPWESAVAGACAGAAYNLALFPADTVKSAVQTAEELRPGQPRPTYFGMARALWAAQGMRGLYAGCGITIARSVPSSALVFAMYDGLRNAFD
jgi:ornithine carrier protein